MTGGLPLWVQYAYVIFQCLTLVGAILWTVIRVNRYMTRTETRMTEMYNLSVMNQSAGQKNQEELRETLIKAAEGIEKLALAQKMSMGVQVVSSLIPTIIAELKGVKRAKSSLD